MTLRKAIERYYNLIRRGDHGTALTAVKVARHLQRIMKTAVGFDTATEQTAEEIRRERDLLLLQECRLTHKVERLERIAANRLKRIKKLENIIATITPTP